MWVYYLNYIILPLLDYGGLITDWLMMYNYLNGTVFPVKYKYDTLKNIHEWSAIPVSVHF